jgi:hypothetical protein
MRLLIVLAASALTLAQATSRPLRIVVLEGENAVNIIQQKTAVRPLVEVRDHNNLPVAGAAVTFSIGAGQPAAFAGGIQTLTVTTNAAGQAAAAGFNVLGPGAVQMQVQAAFQGQIATAAITQTNFATAAAAAQAGAATSATGGSSGGAGGGGGVSGTTLGVVGAALAGGALVATQVGSSGDDAEYRGNLSGQMVVTIRNTSDRFDVTCVETYAITGTMTVSLNDGNSSGQAIVDGTRSFVSSAAANACVPPTVATLRFHFEAAVTGGPSNLVFQATNNFSGPVPDGGTGSGSETVSFTGAVSGETVSGSLVLETQGRSTGSVTAQGVPYTSVLGGTATMTVTLPLTR